MFPPELCRYINSMFILSPSRSSSSVQSPCSVRDHTKVRESHVTRIPGLRLCADSKAFQFHIRNSSLGFFYSYEHYWPPPFLEDVFKRVIITIIVMIIVAVALVIAKFAIVLVVVRLERYELGITQPE